MKEYTSWALLSAFFAGVTAVLAKKGVENVPVNLAVTIRVVVILAFAVGIAIVTKQTKIGEVDSKAWVFLTASGIATGISWLCYFKALSLGPVSAVAPIDKLGFVVAMVLGFVILREAVKPNVLIGGLVVVVGVLITLKP